MDKCSDGVFNGSGGVLKVNFSIKGSNFNGIVNINGRWDRATAKLTLVLAICKYLDEVMDSLEERDIIRNKNIERRDFIEMRVKR